jgi:hypothetical protein
LPFAVRQIRCVSHPQFAGASGQKSTAKYAVLLGFLSFQTGSKLSIPPDFDVIRGLARFEDMKNILQPD